MRNFAYHLDHIVRLQNTLTVAYSEATCKLLHSVAIPCFVDRVAPPPEQLPERFRRETAHYAKYWHALALLRLGIKVYFSDSDAAILQDPFTFQDRRYDIEGLSDWNDRSEIPTPRRMSEQPCFVYITKRDDKRHGGQFIDGYWRHDSSDMRVQRHMNPCQSTGGWFAQPTPAAMLFLEDMLDWMTAWQPEQWDQAGWNELIITHLFGVGSRAPLASHILPMESFSNFNSSALRAQEGLPINQVVLHAGQAHGQGKVDGFRARGLWRAEVWPPEMGAPLIASWGLASCSAESNHT